MEEYLDRSRTSRIAAYHRASSQRPIAYAMQFLVLASFAVMATPILADYWKPEAGTPWQIVLSEDLKAPYPAGIKAIDGDLYSNPRSTWSDLKSSGYRTICYFSAGSYEDWRPDANEFRNDTDIGSPLKGWEGEW